MPELPEVETVARQLAAPLTGRSIEALHVFDDRLRAPALDAVRGRTIETALRLGKQVVMPLVGGRGPRSWLAVHLRMTGRLLIVAHAPAADERHLRAALELDRGWLLFVDPRRFGTLRHHRRRRGVMPPGDEPLSRRFTARRLAGLLGSSRTPLKPWLLRQDRVTGLGNIYASEILHAARLSPDRPAGSLDEAEVRRLHRATRRVLRAAIECCGTTFSDFQDAHGVTGSFQRFLQVYGREGEPCLRCRGPVRRTVQQGRSTFSCGGCQG
jgi:formamidopyrimidine-DNA glycosylase